MKKMDTKLNHRINELESMLNKYSDAYYNEAPLVSDDTFDKLVDELKKLHPKSDFFKTVGAKVTSTLPKVKHKIPMMSLDKVNTPEEVKEWAEKYLQKESAVWSEKLDGLSLEVTFENGKLKQAVTRGDGTIGEDVTENVSKANFKKVLNKPYSGPIRGEVCLDKEDFEKYFKDEENSSEDAKNPRNAAAGTLRRKYNTEKAKYLKIRFYQIDIDVKTEKEKMEFIQSLGLDMPKWGVAKNLAEVEKVMAKFTKERDKLPYEIDGLVLVNNSIEAQNEHGIISKRPRYARAYKFISQGAETKMLSVENQVGRTGIITPVGKIVPTQVAGVTVSSVTLHNYREIKKLGLKLNQRVMIERKGDVIPKITSALETNGDEIKIPTKCPCCGSKLEVKEDLISIHCLNKECPEQKLQNLLFWLQCIDVKGIAYKMVEKLYNDKKVLKIKDFYSLSIEDISSLERSGEKIAVKILKELKDKLIMEPEMFLKGLGIDQLGETTAKLILEKHSLDSIFDLTEDELTAIHGIGAITAASVVSGLSERKTEIKELMKIVKLKEKATGSLTGVIFCFTEVRDKQLEADLKAQGATIADSVNKTLSYLIVKDVNGSSSKIEKARKNNIPIMPITEVRTKFKL